MLDELYRDDALLAVSKPARVLSVPIDEKNSSLLDEVRIDYPEAYPINRLDFETSGIMLFGRKVELRERCKVIFQNAHTKKTYSALVKGIPKFMQSKITFPLAARNRKEFVPAETIYRVDQKFPPVSCALLTVTIRTGRKHQIRQHLSRIYHPVVLDGKYGDVKFNRFFRLQFRLGRQFLHASRIEFEHPESAMMIKIEAPLPPDLQSVLKKLNSLR